MVRDRIWMMMLLVPGVMSAHYSIEYRSHFTHWHITVIGLIGATEQLVFVQAGTLINCFFDESNGFMNFLVPQLAPYSYLIGRPITIGDCIITFAFVTGIHFNSANIWAGFRGAEDKGYAMTTLLPYCSFFVMLFCSSYSRFWTSHTYYFVIMSGLFLTYVTGLLNLHTMAGMKMNGWFYEPLLFCAIVYVDATQNIGNSVIIILYVFYFLQTLVKYLMFMHGVIGQLLEHLDIPFVHVKPVEKSKDE